MAPKKTKKSAAPKKAKRSGGKRKAKETKAEAVEVNNGGVQLLIGNMLPDKDATYHFENILGWMAKVKSAQGKLGDAKKRAKEAGIDVGAIMTVMRMERADPLDVASELKEQARLMRLRGIPVQMQLYEPKYDSVEAQAKAEGYSAGRAGRSMDGARWPEDAPGHAEYVEGWQEGQKEIVLGSRPEGHYEGAGDE